MNRLKNIVIGVDFSDCSRTALKKAVRIARLNSATLHVVHVVEKLVVDDLNEALKKVPQKEIAADACRAATSRLESMVDALDATDLTVKSKACVGTPFIEVLHTVQSTRADLLIIGASGRSKKIAPSQDGLQLGACAKQRPKSCSFENSTTPRFRGSWPASIFPT